VSFWGSCVLATIVFLVSGCSAERSQIRHNDQQMEILSELVEGYWHAVRWGYTDLAADYVEEGDDRAALTEYLLSRQDIANITDVEIYQVKIDDDLMSAIARVQYSLILKNENVLRKKRIRQTWYRTKGNHWFLRLTPDELKRLD